jgi:photosystem II stability/assembly factor-like uncharacterized protein
MQDIIDSSNHIYFNFLDAQHGWLSSDRGLFRTDDGGQTWDQIQPNVIR